MELKKKKKQTCFLNKVFKNPSFFLYSLWSLQEGRGGHYEDLTIHETGSMIQRLELWGLDIVRASWNGSDCSPQIQGRVLTAQVPCPLVGSIAWKILPSTIGEDFCTWFIVLLHSPAPSTIQVI